MEFKGLMRSYFIFLFIGMNLCSGSRLNHFDQSNPVKSIKSRDGDVIDCMDISHQPAFNDHHPLFKNQSTRVNAKKSLLQSWQLDGTCPDGTIAVRRSTQEELTRASSINFHGSNFLATTFDAAKLNTFTTVRGTQQAVAVYVKGEEYYGAMAFMNIWAPKVRPNDVSSSEIVIVGGSGSDLNVILAGWHVYPELYGDHRTRFYTYWSGGSTGCYNLQCPGFVQISKEFALGAPFLVVSKEDTPPAEFVLVISKGHYGWILELEGITIGYWPFSLFTTLKNPATIIEWGGTVFNSQIDGKQSTTTQMGSGHFPEEGVGRAAYMRALQVVDENLSLKGLNSPVALATKPNCYNVTLAKSNTWGDYILYGGPGRNPKCS